MKVLITGICGFVGSTIAGELRQYTDNVSVVGIDNLMRSGSETNLEPLRVSGVDARIGDIRKRADLDQFGRVDWVIDAAANASCLAGVDGKSSATELLDHNLFGTIPVLEYCREHQATFTLLSTSRVYSINHLRDLPLRVDNNAFRFNGDDTIQHVSALGISESFSTVPPLSLYGVSKLCSEQLALEYGHLFEFPVWINRCGVMAGAGQFGNTEQGVFSYWIRSWIAGQPLKYVGFGGHGYQVRDCLNPKDLITLLLAQFDAPIIGERPQILNISGGIESAISLAQLSDYCSQHIHPYKPTCDRTERVFDVPWIVLDSSKAKATWNWQPQTTILDTFQEIIDLA